MAERARPVLTEQQRPLVFQLVEWDRSNPGLEYHLLHIDLELHGRFVEHWDVPDFAADLEQLGRKHFPHLRRAPDGMIITSVMAEAHQYYAEFKRQRQPAEELVNEQRQYVDTEGAKAYPEAVRLLHAAVEQLWARPE
jgi:hypothetical protein